MSDTKPVQPRKGVVAAPAYSHVGLCVSDLERSMRFYQEGLGFCVGLQLENGDGLSHFVGVAKPMRMISQFMSLGGLNLELLAFLSPGSVPREHIPKPLNHVGMTHLSFYVTDVDDVADRLIALGGTLHDDTRVDLDKFAGSDVSVTAVFCTDPDGTRIELMSYSKNFPGFVP